MDVDVRKTRSACHCPRGKGAVRERIRKAYTQHDQCVVLIVPAYHCIAATK
jgi:hypothetical protein